MPAKRFLPLRKFNRAILNPITKSIFAGRFRYCSLVHHIGRRSGKEYATPVLAIRKETHIFIPLTYGPDTDWFLNVRAAGTCQVKIMGKVYYAGEPVQVDAQAAAEAFPNNVRAQIKVDQFLRLTIESES